jgi:hypothetical protein
VGSECQIHSTSSLIRARGRLAGLKAREAAKLREAAWVFSPQANDFFIFRYLGSFHT